VNGLRSSHKLNFTAFVAKAFLACLTLVGAATISVSAQDGPAGPPPSGPPQGSAMSPYQDEGDGVSVGGKWMEFKSEDKMSGARKVRFELLSNNFFKDDPEYKPRVELICSNGKYEYADFNPGVRLAPPNRPGFWGQPQLSVRVRVDDTNSYKGWNWVRGRFLSMDKGTTRGLLGAQVFNVEVPTRFGREIAEFSPTGLNLDEVRKSCDLTPKKPSKD
jgi:hypothetical protein